MRTLAIGILAALLVPSAVEVVVSTGFAQESQVKLSGTSLIDHHIKAKWNDAQLKPAKRADDAEFLRRVYLDIVGVVPSLEEAEKFLTDKSPYKRQNLVEKLVKDARYAEHWADVWTGVIVGFDKEQREQGYRNQAHGDIEEMFAKNMPLDEFARKVITVEGHSPEGYRPMMAAEGEKSDVKEVGLITYNIKQFREAGRDFPKALAGKLTRSFMGVQIQCAQCHDHPFDKWTQEEFYGMASFFTEVQVRRDPDTVKNRGYTVEDRKPAPGGKMRGGNDLSIPDSKSGPIKPAFIESGKGAEAGVARRQTFARHMTSTDNIQFARMAVNRYWSHFFGKGIVNPVDDFNGRNKPSHPELLDGLAKEFIEKKYDLHWLIKTLAASEAYGLSSRSAAKERDPQAEKYFAIQSVRALSPEQIVRSVVEAARLDEGEIGKRMFGRDRGPKGAGKAGMLLMATAQFRTAFDDDEGSESVDFAGTIPSALLMMNSQLIMTGTTAMRVNGFGEMVAKQATPEDKIRAIFLSCLSRVPTSGEMSRWKAHAARAAAAAGYEDLMWTLLNTSEFLFNH